VGVARPGVQEQVGRAQAGDVLGQAQLGCPEHAAGGEAAGLQLGRQVGLGMRVPGQHPQHGLRRAVQDAGPQVQHGRGDLVGLVEAAQHHRVGRQAQQGAGRGRRQGAVPVIGLVAVGQLGDVLAVLAGMGQRHHHRITDHVVEEARTGGGRVAQVGHLHRRRPVGQQLEAAAAGVALEVDGDVDAVGAHAPRHLGIAQVGHVDELVAGGAHAAADLAAVVGAVRVQAHLEAFTVAPLQHLGHQHRGGMLVEVGREVAQADAAGPARPGRRQGLDVARQAAGAHLANAALLRRRGVHRQQGKG